jgi:MoaA/NifB/PqqE/SkfB family radical SAM enzyme
MADMPLMPLHPRAAERLVVVWRVTTRCNLACGFCAYDRTLQFARRDADEATAGLLGHAFTRTRAGSGQDVHVSFLGGEPFSWEPLPRVARHYTKLGLSLGVTTNGVTLSRAATRELLLECFDEVTLSIDGLGAMHDNLRAWPDGFARLTAGLTALRRDKALRGRGPLIRVNTVLMRENIEQFPDLCRALAGLGVQQLSFNRLGGRDRPDFFAAHRLTPEQLGRLAAELPALRRELATQGLSLLGAPGYLERLASLERGQAVAIGDCEPGRRFLFVDEHGRLAPCSFTLDEYGEPAADVAASAGDVLQLPRRFLARQHAARATACDDCASTHVFEKFRGA